jgi:hypothetical protein
MTWNIQNPTLGRGNPINKADIKINSICTNILPSLDFCLIQEAPIASEYFYTTLKKSLPANYEYLAVKSDKVASVTVDLDNTGLTIDQTQKQLNALMIIFNQTSWTTNITLSREEEEIQTNVDIRGAAAAVAAATASGGGGAATAAGGSGGKKLDKYIKISSSNLFACLFQNTNDPNLFAIVINVHLTRPEAIITQRKEQRRQDLFKKKMLDQITEWIKEYIQFIRSRLNPTSTSYYTIIMGGDWNRESEIVQSILPINPNLSRTIQSITPFRGRKQIDHLVLFQAKDSSNSSSSSSSDRQRQIHIIEKDRKSVV